MVKLFVPGPVTPLVYFRDNDIFPKFILENEKLLLKHIGCKKGYVIPYVLSGTGVMDAVVTNLISDNDYGLVINSGGFGQRWFDICNFYNKNLISYPVSFGKDINFNRLEKTIKTIKVDIILVQHHETNSGQLHNIKELGEITKRHNIILIVDAISSFCTDTYHMDDWNVDATIISSQKGLKQDAGVSFLIINDKLLEHSKTVKKGNYYNNIDTYLSDYCLKRGHTPYTPAVNLLTRINKRLLYLNVGYEIKETKEKADYFRQNIKDLPLKHIAETPSNFLTSLLITDENYSAVDLYNHLKSKGMFITKVGKQVERFVENGEKRYFLVSHIGCNLEDHKELIKEIRWFFGKRD